MKKLYIIIACMLFALFGCSINMQAATEKMSIKVGNVTAENEDIITVPVTIANNPGLLGATISISYDNRLSFITESNDSPVKAITAGSALSSLTMTKPGKLTANPIKILWDGTDADFSNGEIVLLKFNNPGQVGKYTIEVSYEEEDIIDGDLNSVEASLENGGITIIDPDQEAAAAVTKTINDMNPQSRTSVAGARTAYNGLTTAQRNFVTSTTLKKLTDAEADIAAADAVIKTINDMDATDRSSVAAARTAYNGLTTAQRNFVTSTTLKKLTDAEAAFEAADQAAVAAVTKTINDMNAQSRSSVTAARTAYDGLTAAQKDMVSAAVLKKLTDAEADIAAADAVIKTINDMVATDRSSVAAARTAYNGLTTAQRNFVTSTTLKKLTDAEANITAADAVIKTINEMDADSRTSVAAARTAYDGLTKDQKDLVGTAVLKKLTDAEAAFEAADQAAADEVTKTINDMNAQNRSSVAAARTAFDGLTDTQKGMVSATVLKKLTDAEADIAAADAVTKTINDMDATDRTSVAAARTAYDGLTTAQKNLVEANVLKKLTDAEAAFEAADQAAVDAVTKTINDMDSQSRSSVAAARTAYDGLTATQKDMVSSAVLKKLTDAETDIAAADAVTKTINDMVATDRTSVTAARTAYNGLTTAQRNFVTSTTLKKLTDAEANITAADAVIKTINDMDTNSRTSVAAARTAYDGLTTAQKDLVGAKVLKKLTDAEAAFEAADQAAVAAAVKTINDMDPQNRSSVQAARAAYDGLTAAQKDMVSAAVLKKLTDAEADIAAADAVIKTINDMVATDRTSVAGARTAYNGLTTAQRNFVTSTTLKKLTDAETDIAAADAVTKTINEMDTNSRTGVAAARAAYDGLTTAQKNLVEANVLKKLTDAEAAFEAADQAAAAAVTKTINDMVAADRSSVQAARAAYDGLTTVQKGLIADNVLKKLTDAEADIATADAVIKTINEMDAESRTSVAAARRAYDGLTSDQKKLVEPATLKKITDAEEAFRAADQAAADVVTKMINEMDSTDKSDVEAAREAYDNLTADQKLLVETTTLKKLTDAEDAIAAAEEKERQDQAAAAAVTKMIKQMDPEDKDSVVAAREAYDGLTGDQKRLIETSTLSKLTDAEAAIAAAEEKERQDQAAVAAFVEIINEMDSTDKASVAAAREAYDSLTVDQKNMVEAAILKKLTDAEDAIETAEEKGRRDRAAADSVTTTINEMDPFDKASVVAARGAYNLLTEDQKQLIEASILKKLTDAEEAIEAADQAAAAAVINMINEMNQADKASVEAARDAYDSLTSDQKKLVEAPILKKLTDAEDAIAAAEEKERQDQSAAAEVTKAIKQMDPADKASVQAAREAYDALTEDQKNLVDADTIKKLTDAETAIEAAEKEKQDQAAAASATKTINEMDPTDKDSVKAAREAYDALTEDQKNLVDANTLKKLTDAEEAIGIDAEKEKQDQAAAVAVTKKINEMDPADKASVKAAKKAYESLTEDQKKLVEKSTLKKLTDAEAAIKKEEDQAAAASATKAINEMKPADKKSVEAARKAYNALTADQKKLVEASVLKKLTDAEAAIKQAENQQKETPLTSKIVLTGISHKIAEGKTIKLEATVFPNGVTSPLKWTSSDEKVATVTQSGQVTIKKGAGKKSVTIKATATDGTGVSATWDIKAMKGVVKKIKVKGYKKTLKAGKTMKLKASVLVGKKKPINKKLKWTTSNKNYATVTQSGKVKALKAGKGKKVKITVMSTDGSNKKKQMTIKIK